MRGKMRDWVMLLAISLMIVGMVVNVSAGWVETEASGDVTYFEGGKVKSVSPGEDDMWSVVNVSNGTLIMVSPEKKSYATATMDEFCAFISRMMGGMTPQQKAMMEAMMKKQRPKEFKVKKVGSGGKVAGYSTDKYQVQAGGAPYMEVWVSTDKTLNSSYGKMMEKAMPQIDKMASCSAMGGGGVDFEDSKEYKKLEKKGWVLKKVANGEVVSETLKLEQKKIPASEFEVPSGYKKVSLEQIMGG